MTATRSKFSPLAFVLALALLATIGVVRPPSSVAYVRTVFTDNFDGVSETVGAPPNNWNIFLIPPFNDNHSTRWAIESNSAGSPTHVDGGGTKSLGFDDVSTKPSDNFNDDGSRRDDFPVGVVYRNPSASADQPGNLGTYTVTASVRSEDVGARITENSAPLEVDGELFTFGAALGSILWPPGNSQPCPDAFGGPSQQCRPAAGLAAGVVISDPGTTFDSDPTDDKVEVGALYFSGWVNQDEVTNSGFDAILVPVRTDAIFDRADFFGSTHTIDMHVSQNRYVGVTVDGHFYGWGEVKNPDGSDLLVPPSRFTGYALAGVVRNHVHFDNVIVRQGLPNGLPATTPTPSPTATPDGTPTPTPSITPTPTPSGSPTPTPSGEPTPSPTPVPTAVPTPTPTPVATPEPEGTTATVQDDEGDGVVGLADTDGGEALQVDARFELPDGVIADVTAKATETADGSDGTVAEADPVRIAWTNPKVSFDLPLDGLDEGEVTVEVTAVRTDGEVVTLTRVVEVDLTPPTTTITTEDESLFYSVPIFGYHNIRVDGSAADAGGVKIVALTFTNDDFGGTDGPFVARRSGDAESPTWTLSGYQLNYGRYTVRAYSIDEAGNVGPEVTGTIWVL